VRISASEVVAAEVLPRAVRRLRQNDPGLSVEVSVTNEQEDVLRRGADIAVRMARPKERDLLARKVGDVELGLFAHPSYLKGRQPPATVEKLLCHSLVGFQTERTYTGVLQFAGKSLRADDFAYRSDSDTAQLGAIRAGLGIGVCHVPLARALVRVLPEEFAPKVEMWLVINSDLMRTRRYREAFRTLSDELRAYVRSEL
jgi:DNA-binding transcriptional LysR family regulator